MEKNMQTENRYNLSYRLKQVKKSRWIRFTIVAILYIGGPSG